MLGRRWRFLRSLIVGFFLSSLVASPLVCDGSDVGGSSGVPFLVAQKKASRKRLKTGAERVLVSLDIYNQGFYTAYDVSLVDDSWSKDVFQVISGNIPQSWERLNARKGLSRLHTLPQSCLLIFFPEIPPGKKFEWRLLAKYP
ncbi:hypothetical protein MLD38_022598 [Melastoma candidum]|uniref:Uncharacterized protein n=1 Tax=Melastoma candidum TaxID=119954 RepID=A0ACB9QJV0_9MYRT|nr:hypothetical protein MLD38_022598 [Melastoma candidum]